MADITTTTVPAVPIIPIHPTFPDLPNEESPEPDTVNSILYSVKKMLGLQPEYEEFDTDIIININNAIMILNQIGVGPDEDFFVIDSEQTYADYLGDGSKETSMVKQYLYLKTRLGFDPPENSSVASSMKEMISELEWRLNVQADLIKKRSSEECDCGLCEKDDAEKEEKIQNG